MAKKKSNSIQTAQQKVAQKASQATQFVTTTAPVAKGTKRSGARAPQVKYASDGSCAISHTEYMFDVSATNQSTATAYALNPQSSEVFTWLSAIATRFEMYRFKQLSFHYKPSCSTATDGFVALGFDFDYYDVAPQKQVMLAWKYSTRSAPWQENKLDVSSDSRSATKRYCHTRVSGPDSRLDFLGNFYVLADSQVANSSLGELYVSYTIEFFQPAYNLPPAIFANFDKTGWSGTDYFAGSGVPVSILGNMATQIITGSQLLLKSPGKYLVEIVNRGTGFVSAPVASFAAAGAYPNADWAFTLLETAISSTISIAVYELQVYTTGVLMNLAFGGGSTASSSVRFGTFAKAA